VGGLEIAPQQAGNGLTGNSQCWVGANWLSELAP